MPNNEPQPGPSGYKKPINQLKFDNEASKQQQKRAKSRKQQHSRRSSYDVALRYKLRERQEGTQQSHSVRKIVAAPRPFSSKERQVRLIVHEPEPIRCSHHHLEAVDYYYRSTAYGHRHKDDIKHLRQKAYSRRKLEKSKIIEPIRRPRIYCKNCLEPITNCICVLGVERPPTSDWGVIFQFHPDRTKGFTKHRLEWLEKLEKLSKFDLKKFQERNFDISKEICCFPFNTFRIFSKREVECADYYKKNP